MFYETEKNDEIKMLYATQLEILPVTSEQINSLTEKYRTLAQFFALFQKEDS